MSLNPSSITQQASSYFEAQIRQRLAYWGKHKAVATLDIDTLDRRRDSVLNVISFGLELQDAWPLVRDLMLAFTRFMERRGHWQVWNDLLHRAIDVANHVGDTDGAVTISALLARTYSRQSRPKETIYYYRRVIRLARQSNNLYEEARACTNLGFLYIEMSRWWRAEVLCCYVMALIEDLDSDHLQAVTDNHLGLLYTRQNKWGKAEYHLKKACALWESMTNDRGNLQQGFANLGVLFNLKVDPDSAIFWHNKALEQAITNGDESHQGVIMMNLAIAYQDRNFFDQATNLCKEAEALLRQSHDTLNLTRVLANLGILYRQQKNWGQSLEYIKAAFEGYQTLNNWEGQLECLFDYLDYAFDVEDYAIVSDYLVQTEQMIAQYTQGTHRAKLIERLAPYQRRLDEVRIGEEHE